MVTFGKTRESLSVVNDQIGMPTYTYDLSRLIVYMVESNQYGVYHATMKVVILAGMISLVR